MLRRHFANPLSAALPLAVLVCVLVLAFNAGSAAAASGTLSVSPATQTVSTPGVNFTVDIVQHADVTTSGVQTDFSFDKSILQIQSITIGSAYSSGGQMTWGDTIANANTTGVMPAIAVYFVNGSSTVPANVDAIAVTIVLQGTVCGSSSLTLGRVEMIDSTGAGVPVTPASGQGIVGQASRGWVTPPGDSDCDGFPNSVPIPAPNALNSESNLGTDPAKRCAATPARNDEPPPDAWPVDFDDNQVVNGSDLLTFAPVFGSISGDGRYNVRWDLNNDGKISGSDLLKFAPFFGKHCV